MDETTGGSSAGVQPATLRAPPVGNPWPTPAPGDLVDGQYRVEGTLGRGGMGVVLLARDERLDRPVALKMVRPALVMDEAHRSHLQREARLLAEVKHPNVVRVFAFGTHEGAPYFAMEYVDGITLTRQLKNGGVSVEEAIDILVAVCKGADAMHDAGVVHGDIKPGNIIVGGDGRVCLMDFGVALSSGERTPNNAFGTAEYIAPELIRGSCTDRERAAIDVYSLGVLAYEVISGRLPFEGDRAALFAMHLCTVPPVLSTHAPQHWRYDAPVAAALAKEASDRPPSPGSFAAMLRAAQRAEPGGRVLIVDDDPDFATLVGTVLATSSRGITTHHVANGDDAIEVLGRELAHIDVIVLDLHVPGAGWRKMLEAFRVTAPQVPVFIVTGRGGADEWAEARWMGAQAFAVKPILPDAFLAQVELLLSRPPES